MDYRYFICDVFTKQRFSGNPLAVISEAQGLSDFQMQQIAREFNFSETTFVFPAHLGQTRQVRIFTPVREIPFAGHPNIGTAFALAQDGAFGNLDNSLEVVFEEAAGLVPVSINKDHQGLISCELNAPEPLWLGKTVSKALIANILNLNTSDILCTTHEPQEASVGLEFLFVEIASYEALKKAQVNLEALTVLSDQGVIAHVHLYFQSHDEFDVRVRMFAPLDGVPEDPATGSANCALVALLSHFNSATEGDFNGRISQGSEMGRPSVLNGRTEKRQGRVSGVWISGNSVLVSEGTLKI
jgi:trans-2,3-dihydro-3-hydroxyanthranilate isomerase